MSSRLTLSLAIALTSLLAGNAALALPGDQPSPARSTLSKVFAVPKAAASILCGLTIGVPVSIAHDISEQTKRMQSVIEKDLSDSAPTLQEKVVASSLSVPYGVMSGLVKGSIQGTQRAVEYGSTQPFSKESMSLEQPKNSP